MDALFRLVTPLSTSTDPDQYLQQSSQSYNNSATTSTRTSTSSRTYHHHHFPEQEECFNPNFMDEEDFSSSSNNSAHKHYSTPYNYYVQPTTTTPPHHGYDHHHFSYSPAADLSREFFSSPSSSWASDILLETARAMADNNTGRLQQLMWMLNEISSPYGDTHQKLASYFLQALFSRMTNSGDRCRRTMAAQADKSCSFESTRKTLLKFQEVSPWTTFGHVACNGAIFEALEGEPRIHIVDISNTFCTQWPTLLEAIATRSDDAPHVRLTVVVVKGGAGVQRVMREIGSRMERFARLMGVPFKFHVIHHNADLSELDLAELDIGEDEALAINCVNTLHSVSFGRRDAVLAGFRRVGPRVVTVVEEEAELAVGAEGYEFVKGFGECVRWMRVYLEALEESFPRASNERVALEKEAGRAVMELVGCGGDGGERREAAARWGRRMRRVGFSAVGLGDEVCDDVRALLRRYREGWSMVQSPEEVDGVFLAWKDQPVVWAAAWKP